MKLSRVMSMSVLATMIAAGAKAGPVEIQAGKAKVHVGGGVRTSFKMDDMGRSKTKGVDPKADNSIDIDRSDLNLSVIANDKLSVHFRLQPHVFQRGAGSDAAVEAAYFDFKLLPMLSVAAGIQSLNLGGVETSYEPIDVYYYSEWYRSHAFGSQGLAFAPAIAPKITAGPVEFTLQLADRNAADGTMTTTATGTTTSAGVDPIAITSRLDVKLPVGDGAIVPSLTYATITNQQKQMTVGVFVNMAGIVADVGYNQAMYAKNDELGGNISTDKDGKTIDRTVSSIEVSGGYKLALDSSTSVMPWIKYANLSDDRKEAGTAPKALGVDNSEIFLGVSFTVDAMTAALSYAMESGDYISTEGKEETRTNGTLGIHLTGKI